MEFVLCTFKLDCQRALPLAREVADSIGLRYGRLFLRAKSKFHANLLKIEIARLKMLTLQRYRYINKMKQKLKYIQSFKVTRAKEASIFKAIRNQQQTICHQLCAYTKALEELIIIKNFANDALQEWSAKNPDLIHSVKSSGNKPLSIFRSILILGAVTNQVDFPSMDPNNANTSESDRKNAVVIDSTIVNKKMEESGLRSSGSKFRLICLARNP